MDSTNEINGAALFKVVDKYLSNNSKWVNPDCSLDELGAFCNLLLPYLQNLLKAHKGDQAQFRSIVEKCKSMFAQFQTLLKDKDAKFLEVTQHLVELLEHMEENSEEKVKEIKEIYRVYYSLFYGQMARAQAHITLTTGKQSRTREAMQAQEAIKKYLTRTLDNQKPDDAIVIDPLLLDVESCHALEKFLVRHRRPYLRCFCGQKADVFALPCNCPCYCSECWEFEGDPSAEMCPRCHRPVAEFVQITHPE